MLPGEQGEIFDTTKNEEVVSRRAKDRIIKNKQSQLLQEQYLVQRQNQIAKLRSEAEPSVIKQIEVDVNKSLIRFRGLISDEKYFETFEHKVNEELAKLFMLPSFNEWLKEKTH